jgi:hypothetical protein
VVSGLAKGLVRRAVPAPLWARLKELRKARRNAARVQEEARLRSEWQTRLLAADPALRPVSAHEAAMIGRRVDAFTAAGAAEDHLRAVVGAADAAGIGYFMVPGKSPLRHVVGLLAADRPAFLAALRERSEGAARYLAKPEPGASDEIVGDPVGIGAGPLPKRIANARALRFGSLLLGPADQLLSGLELGCDVEFWDEADAMAGEARFLRRQETLRVRIPPSMFAGAWVAPRGNAVADVLPAEARVPAHRQIGERKYETFAPFNRRLVDEVDFPIDAVYMWVDGDDPEWAAQRARYAGGDAPQHLSGASCYVSRDELKYSLRSLHAFAPFIRNVYLVTAGQTPHWLDTEAPGIRVVDHAEIFADPSVLPVFNSQAIEAQLHRIPGLADRYLVLNDDTFFRRPVPPTKYFHGNGIALLPFSPAQIGLGRPRTEEPAPSSAGKNVRALLEADFDRFITSKFKHVPHPQIRAVAEELEERYAEEVAATTASRFRAPDNINFATALHHHYAMFTGRAVPGNFRLRYIDVTAPTAPEHLAELEADRKVDSFCLNDIDTNEGNAAQVDALVRGFLERMFPFPSPFEKA